MGEGGIVRWSDIFKEVRERRYFGFLLLMVKELLSKLRVFKNPEMPTLS